MTAIDEKNPQILYHYTSIKGLIGIIENKNIWATSIYHLNDKEELFHARDMLLKAISDLKSKIEKEAGIDASFKEGSVADALANPFNPKRVLLKMLIDVLMKFSEEVPVFISSFSEKGDVLSQWRGYCPSSNGFSVGFNFIKLKKQLVGKGCILRKCIYDKDEQNKIVDRFLQEELESKLAGVSELLTNTESLIKEMDKIGEFVKKILKRLLLVLPILKNEAFEEEQEWRLIGYFPEDKEIKFREGKTVLIPYREINLVNDSGELPLASITIGPTPNKLESHKSLNIFLKTKQLDDLGLSVSSIPYREI